MFQGIGKLTGTYELKIREDAIPVALREATNRKLDGLEHLRLIQKILFHAPYEWCSNLHVVPKKNGDVRLTIDPRKLNKVIRREFHPMSTIKDIATRVHGSKMFNNNNNIYLKSNIQYT